MSENSEDLSILRNEYEELCNSIRESLKALEPWYIGGKVGNPMDAVNALKSIDKAVNS